MSRASLALAAVLGIAALAMFLWWVGILDPFKDRIPADAFRLVPINQAASETAVVFVHGLDGDPLDTFKASGVETWAGLMKTDSRPFPGTSPPPPLSTYATYALDYRRLYASDNTIQQAAEQIAERLISDDLFKKHNHVWFITHSLGGVLMKRVLLLYDGQGAQRLLDRVAGMFLFGVPSQGSPLANLDDNDKVALLTAIVGRRHHVVRDLRTEEAAAFLGSLEKSWGDFIRRRRAKGQGWPPYVHCAYEVDETFYLAKVVPALFAQTECTDGSHSMSKDHITLVKPLSTDDQVYSWTRERFRRGREQLRNWTLFEIKPGVEPLSKLTTDYQQLHRRPPDDAGLLEVPEAIDFLDARSQELATQLLLVDNTYRGTTAADVFERIAEANRCVSVNISADRRQVTIAVAEPLMACPGGSSVCKGQPCPARPRKPRS